MTNEKYTLYIGLDDSNHGNYPELCLAYFSTIPKDKYTIETSVKRDSSLKSRSLSPKRDYRFLLLEEANIERGKNNLTLTTSSLILPYLKENEDFERLEIFIDGRLRKPDRDYIQNKFSNYAREIEVKGEIKKKRRVQGEKVKFYTQPFLLIFADFQVNHLYTEFSLEQLHNHPKRVAFQS